MKSRLRSRWYRPNEKPLESPSGNNQNAEPFGEIQCTDSKLVDDLSKVKVPQTKETRNYSKKTDDSKDRTYKSRPKHQKKTRDRNDAHSNNSETRHKSKKDFSKKNHRSDDPNYKPRRRRKNTYSEDGPKDRSPKNKSSQIEKKSSKKSGISSFLSKIFGG
jgi:hypothetical protein